MFDHINFSVCVNMFSYNYLFLLFYIKIILNGLLCFRVADNCRLNSMDSKNLAICWWPTLLPLEFSDMMMFERMRPHLEDSVQTMIDQFRFLFCGEEEVVMV